MKNQLKTFTLLAALGFRPIHHESFQGRTALVVLDSSSHGETDTKIGRYNLM
ncbi:MAG: hypothetical protein KJ709_01615 [Nanoarchaeota archaeon]|nr:hypothetical protein [Nanoarchaeota archaeon]